MSNPLAIAAVTATLRNLLTTGLADVPGLKVSVQPPHKARRDTDTGNQLNLFLYQTTINSAWRNMDLPRQVQPGETGQPPLALDLYYLLTAYGEDEDATDPASHRLLGRAMSILHDHPLLGAAEIQAAEPGNDLYEQIERVRVNPQAITVEELSKLWTIFQTQYHITVAYHVAVVLIESTRPLRAPLPVLMRGPGDVGPAIQPSMIPPFPTLTTLDLPGNRPSAHLGHILTLHGHHLSGAAVKVRFSHPRLLVPIDLSAQAGATDTAVAVQITNAPTVWPAGFYTSGARHERSRRASDQCPAFRPGARRSDHHPGGGGGRADPDSNCAPAGLTDPAGRRIAGQPGVAGRSAYGSDRHAHLQRPRPAVGHGPLGAPARGRGR